MDSDNKTPRMLAIEQARGKDIATVLTEMSEELKSVEKVRRALDLDRRTLREWIYRLGLVVVVPEAGAGGRIKEPAP